MLAALGACEFDKVGIQPTESQLATHGVLSATAPTQVVLVERTRNGTVQSIAPPFDLEVPLVTDEGIAETGAIVSLTTPSGATLFAREDYPANGDGSGRGVYRFFLPGSTLDRNGTYKLSILTSKGERVNAETAVPGGTAVFAPDPPRTFDRAADAASIEWPAAQGARSYYVRIETPFGPRAFFTDSTRVRLPGELRNVDLKTLRHVFVPGFPQTVTVSAVDSNFYDWYRTHNDPLSGEGLANRVTLGFGFFGSLVRLRFLELDVVAPQTEPIAGKYRVVGPPDELIAGPHLGLELYVESPSARSDQPDALSGRVHRKVTFSSPGCEFCGVLGTAQNGRVTLNFLRDWSASDTAEVLTGEIRGDTIVGQYRTAGGFAHFVRER
ncbi:MAG TPA: hypothetical protein VGP25_14470 [Gemmatimonadaceae bacterium]|jgi:hypothetical protein|nr:hypothetical protein [Gemmatimonadaceae bacterium]